MEQYALLIAATLNAGTGSFAIAALGLLINEKSGIVNLGAEGMMLCAAIAGFATVVHTGNDWLGFAAGMGAARLLAGLFAAGHLAQHQSVRHRALHSLFGAGFSAFVGNLLRAGKTAGTAALCGAGLAIVPFIGPALFRSSIHGLYRYRRDCWHSSGSSTAPAPVWCCARWAKASNRACAAGLSQLRRIRLLAVLFGGAIAGWRALIWR